jgi:hypothetical protein
MVYQTQGDIMSASTASTRGGFGRTAKMLVLGAMIACFGVFALAGPAKAAPVSMELTNGQLNLGFAFKGAEILPAPPTVQLSAPPAPATPLPDLWDARDTVDTTNPLSALPAGCLTPALLNITVNPPTPVGANPEAPCAGNPASATVSGDLTGNAVTIPGSADGGLGAVPGTNPPTSFGLPSGFRFPIMVVPNPLDGSPVPVSIASTGDLTGTFESGTGELTLNGPIEARVLTGLASNPLGSYCALPLTGLTLSTTSNDDFPGVPFTSGFDQDGALTGTYNITDDATSVGGADCGTVNSVSKGLGSVWVSSGIAEPPVCPEFTTGIPPNCEPIPCPPGFSGNEPNCVQLKARIGSVTVAGPRNLRRGKTVTLKVRIKNTGNAQAKGVRLIVSGRGIRFNTAVGNINAGVTRVVNVRIRPTRKGRVNAGFRADSSNAGSRSIKKVFVVR